MYWIVASLIVGAVFVQGSLVWAEDKLKGSNCQEQLQEQKVRAYNLDQDRDNKEQTIAKIQSVAMNLQQQVQALQKQIADMKKVGEPTGDPKKPE